MATMTLVSIESTQAIQTFPPSVRLVAYKRTVVRVMVRHNLGAGVAPRASARLRAISSTGAASPWFDPANGSAPFSHVPGHALTLQAAPDRENTDDSFNFHIPIGWCTGSVQWECEVRIDPASLPPSLQKNPLHLVHRSPPVAFQPRRRLALRYLRVLWPVTDANGTTTNTLTTPAQCRQAMERACQLIPTPPPLIDSALNTTIPIDLSQADPVWDLLRRVGLFRQAIDPTTQTVRDPVSDGVWCAIYDNSDYAVQGLATVDGSEFVANAQRIPIAHEFGHCLHQEHLAALCPLPGPPPANAEQEQSFAGGAKIADVPFDVLGNQVAAKPPGRDRWDMMTYCDGANWVSVERWRRLWDRIGA